MFPQIFKRDYFQQVLSLLKDKEKKKALLRKIGFYTISFLILFIIGSIIPEGFDWQQYFKAGRLHPIWTPWTKQILQLVVPPGYGLVFALTVLSIGIRAYRYKPAILPLCLALFSMPTMWVLFMGNIDGLVLFGLLIMPVGIPLVLMKPQVAAFALLSRRSWFLAGAIWLLISLLIWGFWPVKLLMVTTPEWKAEWVQDISIFPWGLLLGLPLLWYSRKDQDLLMAAGSLLTPHLFPYHFIVLMPALARMKWTWMLITWLTSWAVVLVNWLGSGAWHIANLLSLCFWFGIYLNAKDRSNSTNPLKKFTIFQKK
jgi:hypothetical protein